MFGFLLAAAFGCSSPFWDLRTGRCFNQPAFWLVFGVYDIITDTYSIFIVMKATADLQLNSVTKGMLMVLLGSKFL
jgi:hypothetical protein